MKKNLTGQAKFLAAIVLLFWTQARRTDETNIKLKFSNVPGVICSYGKKVSSIKLRDNILNLI